MLIIGTNSNDRQYGTNSNDTMSAHGGKDLQYGYGGNDYLLGGPGNDYQYGSDGKDKLYGNSGYDYLYGGYGKDVLTGGYNADFLTGGHDTSIDIFCFRKGDSNNYTGGADTIMDWNVSYDRIDALGSTKINAVPGDLSNYAEASTEATSIDNARSQLYSSTNLLQKDHVFLYNSSTDTGYLFSDLDNNVNSNLESGIIILNAGSGLDMNYWNII